jgi:hypothetical protein
VKPSTLVTISIILYATIWIGTVLGISLVRRGDKRAKSIRTWLLNKRIDQFRHPPFKNMLKLWIARKFLLTSTSFIVLIIIPAALLYFVVGIILITPLLTLYQGLVVGLLIARYDRRHMVWALIVGPFEFGYWALSGALGMSVTAAALFSDLSFAQSFLVAVDTFLSGYWIPIAICILINAFGEVAGPIYWKMTGPISLEALSKGEPIDEDA